MSSGERGEDCRREVYVERFFKNESFIFSDISNLEFKQKLYGAIFTNSFTIFESAQNILMTSGLVVVCRISGGFWLGK